MKQKSFLWGCIQADDCEAAKIQVKYANDAADVRDVYLLLYRVRELVLKKKEWTKTWSRITITLNHNTIIIHRAVCICLQLSTAARAIIGNYINRFRTGAFSYEYI